MNSQGWRAVRRRQAHDRRHGEIFPLPHLDVESRPTGAPRYAHQRWKRRRELQGQVNRTVDSLNQLAAATTEHSGQLWPASPSYRRATVVQNSVLTDLTRKVAHSGSCPDDLGEQRALKELLKAKSLYAQEPQNLAPFCAEKLKILRGNVTVKDAKSLLPPEARKCLEHSWSQIELGEEAVAEARRSRDFPRPYWDPSLRHRPHALDHLLRRLHEIGLVSFRAAIKAEIGLFTVHKKGNMQRLIIDARQANFCHRAPPSTRLGSPSALAELDLSDEALVGLQGGLGGVAEIEVRSSSADVDDSFYQFAVPEVACWFGIKRKVDAYSWGARRIFDDETRRYRDVLPGELLHPVFEGMAMGWAWALHICNESVAHLARLAQGPTGSPLVRERRPAPDISVGRPAVGVYVDNVVSIGIRVGDSASFLHRFVEECKQADVSIHIEGEDLSLIDALGVEICGRSRTLRHPARRLWRVHLAGRALLRRQSVHPLELQVWLGHYIYLSQLCRPLMAVPQAIYAWMRETGGRRAPLWPSVRAEVNACCQLIFLAEHPLALPIAPIAYVSDSSDFGYALMSTLTSHAEAKAAMRYRERWRFRAVTPLAEFAHFSSAYVDPSSGASLLGGLVDSEVGECRASDTIRGQTDAGVGTSTAYSEYLQDIAGRSQAKSQRSASLAFGSAPRSVEVEVLNSIPEPDACWDPPERWKTLYEGRWAWPEEHINIKEGRASVMLLRRHTRSVRNHRTRLLQFSDNLVSVCAFEKGRGKSWPLNTLCRRSAAYQLAASVQWRLRHLVSARNPADAGSRRHEQTWPHRGRPPEHLPVAEEPVEEVIEQFNLERPVPVEAPAPAVAPLGVSCSSTTSPAASRCTPEPPPGPVGPVPIAKRRPLVQREGQVFLELFGGVGGLSRAVRAAGLRTGPVFELASGAEFDLTRRSTQLLVLAWIRTGRIWGVHLGTPCSAWSIARRGVKNLRKARNKELIAVELALFSAEIVTECARNGVRWSIENPRSSRLWAFDPIARLLALPGAHYIYFDMCRYTSQHRKPTALLTDNDTLDVLGALCNHDVRHEPLAGSVRVRCEDGRFRYRSATALAAAYPAELCRRWAAALDGSAPLASKGEQPGWLAAWHADLQGLVRRGRSSRRLADLQELRGDEMATVTPYTAIKYLRTHDVTFGGSVGRLPAGSHDKFLASTSA